MPKLRAREHGIPAKILLVDDDELELSLMADRLRAVGYEIAIAHNGEEALRTLDEQWFPLILADWHMPVMDGLQLIEQIRLRGGSDSYFIMLSGRASSEDFERGYSAGVDDYLSKKWPDADLLARIEAGLNTVALRRSLREARAALAESQTAHWLDAKTQSPDAGQGEPDARTELLNRLQVEIARARRYRRSCSVLVLGVGAPAVSNANSAAATIDANLQEAFMNVLKGGIRLDVDFVVLYESNNRQMQFAVVLPETGPAEVATIRSRIRAALARYMRDNAAMSDAFDLSIGAASADPAINKANLKAAELLDAAEHCRDCMATCGARRLAAVQTSVINQVAIPCRYGYAVADHCLELAQRYAAEQQAVAAIADPANRTRG